MADDLMNKEDFNAEAERVLSEKETPKNKSLGKVKISDDINTNVMDEIGWIMIKNEELPSQGIFYPRDTQITIRAALVSEIRHWSTIDEEDILSMDDALNRLVDKCCKIKFPNSMGSFKDLKEIDRFYIVFAIREYTFKKGENNLDVTFRCKSCEKSEKVKIVKEMLSYYVPSTELQTRFKEDERCFHLNLTNGEDIKLYLPSLGVMTFIKGYLREKRQSGDDYDKAFIKWAPFLFADWRILNEAVYSKFLQDSFGWSHDKISVVDWFVEQMQKTVKAELSHKCSNCGSEVTAPISFRGGIKSLLLISNFESKLLRS